MTHILFFFTKESSVQNISLMYMRIFLEFFHFDVKHFLLIYTHTLCCLIKRKHVNNETVKNKLDYLMVYLNMNYRFLFL